MAEPLTPYAPPSHAEPPGHGAGAEATAHVQGSPYRRPDPALAGVLSLLLPGLGHVYVGRNRRALAWLAAMLAFGVVMLITMHGAGVTFGVWLGLATLDTVLIRAGATLDAVLVARRQKMPRARTGVVLLAALGIVALCVTQSLVYRRFVLEAFTVPSASMVPTIFAGDHVLVDKMRAPRPGDLLAFIDPEHQQAFIKRVLAVGGQRVEFRGRQPVIDGQPIPSCEVGPSTYDELGPGGRTHSGRLVLEAIAGHPYLAFYDDDSELRSEDWGPYTVKRGEVFVVGDNRDNSHDSRAYVEGAGGGLPVASEIGIPFSVWSSSGKNGFDPNRVGLNLGRPNLPWAQIDLQPQLDACIAKLTGK
jgi:signal peptidase I